MKLKDIKEIIDNYSGLDIGSKTNRRDYSELRSIANYCFFRYADQYVSSQILGRFWNRSHATVIHSLNNFYTLYDVDDKFKKQSDIIIDMIKCSKEAEKPLEVDIDSYNYLKLRNKCQKLLERLNKKQKLVLNK